MSLITYTVCIDLFSNGHFFVKKATSISNAEDAMEKLLFEITQHEFPNLFFV